MSDNHQRQLLTISSLDSSFPYNATLAKNVMDVVEGGEFIACTPVEWVIICTAAINFLTFEDWQKLTPFPFTEASVNLDFEFARIRKTKYKVNTPLFARLIASNMYRSLKD